jgi:hypothetical protein
MALTRCQLHPQQQYAEHSTHMAAQQGQIFSSLAREVLDVCEEAAGGLVAGRNLLGLHMCSICALHCLCWN